MVLNQGDLITSDEDNINNAEKVAVDNIIKHVMRLLKVWSNVHSHQTRIHVYNIKERLLRQKPLLMREMTLKETFLKAIQQNASSSL